MLQCGYVYLIRFDATDEVPLPILTQTNAFYPLLLPTVTKNDDATCNPNLGEEDVLSILIGVALTFVTLGYAGWSATADEKLSGGQRYVRWLRCSLDVVRK